MRLATLTLALRTRGQPFESRLLRGVIMSRWIARLLNREIVSTTLSPLEREDNKRREKAAIYLDDELVTFFTNARDFTKRTKLFDRQKTIHRVKAMDFHKVVSSWKRKKKRGWIVKNNRVEKKTHRAASSDIQIASWRFLTWNICKEIKFISAKKEKGFSRGKVKRQFEERWEDRETSSHQQKTTK